MAFFKPALDFSLRWTIEQWDQKWRKNTVGQ